MGKIHQPCDDCGSSDALQINDDGSKYCHACQKFTVGERRRHARNETPSETPSEPVNEPISIPKGNGQGLPERGLTGLTLARYGVVVDGGAVYFPYYNKDEQVATKVRRLGDKVFYAQGDFKQAGLFGQQLFPAGDSGKTITITEGETDALSVYQMTGSKYAVVSIPKGASAALSSCRKAYDYINSFTKVLICFDNDDPGRDAAKHVASLFAGKSYVVDLSEYKDANDYLVNDKCQAFVNAWYGADRYRPDDIVSGEKLHDMVLQPTHLPFARYPFDGLNLKTFGIRSGELVTLVAGSGVGKSTFMKSCIAHVLDTTDINVGVLSLEESVGTAATSLMSATVGKALHLPTKDEAVKYCFNNPETLRRAGHLADAVTVEEREAAYQLLYGTGRVHFYSSGGNTRVDDVLERMRYFALVEECKILILDHISILVGMQQAKTAGNEREAIDAAMHSLRSLVEETGVTVLLVSHISRGDSASTPAEEGGRVRMNQIRGSQAIAQLSNIAIALERNTQAELEEDRDVTTVRVLKNRYSGVTGVACKLRWIASLNKQVEEQVEEGAI